MFPQFVQPGLSYSNNNGSGPATVVSVAAAPDAASLPSDAVSQDTATRGGTGSKGGSGSGTDADAVDGIEAAAGEYEGEGKGKGEGDDRFSVGSESEPAPFLAGRASMGGRLRSTVSFRNTGVLMEAVMGPPPPYMQQQAASAAGKARRSTSISTAYDDTIHVLCSRRQQ
jgi:hypothetical protein